MVTSCRRQAFLCQVPSSTSMCSVSRALMPLPVHSALNSNPLDRSLKGGHCGCKRRDDLLLGHNFWRRDRIPTMRHTLTPFRRRVRARPSPLFFYFFSFGVPLRQTKLDTALLKGKRFFLKSIKRSRLRQAWNADLQ